jgi:AAA domain
MGTSIEAAGIYQFQDFMNLTLRPPTPAVEGLINEGQNGIFAGYFGVGKTMFASQLSLSLATSRDFLGRMVSRPYKVVFLDYETGPGTIKERISRQQETAGLTDSDREALSKHWIYVNALDELCPFYGLQMDDEGLARLTGFLDDAEAEVLIVDNLGWFIDGDLTDPDDVKKLYQRFRELRARCRSMQAGIILLLHHLTKPGEKSGRCSLLTAPREYLSMARGSQRLLDYAECRLALAEEVVDDQVFHIINGINRSGAVDPMVVQLGFETLSFALHEDAQFRYKQAFNGKPIQKQLFEALPGEQFTWTQAKTIALNGKPVTPDTLSATLRTAKFNQFITQDTLTKHYRKVFLGPY